MKKIVLILIVIILAAGGAVFYFHTKKSVQSPAGGITVENAAPAATPGQNFQKNKNMLGMLTGQVTLSSKPYPILIDITGPKVFMELHANTAGIYKTPLPAGSYSVMANTGGSLYPRCQNKKVAISSGATTTANIACN